MKKSKLIISSIFLVLASVSLASGGLSYVEPTRVYATVKDDGTFDGGNKTITFNTQSSVASVGRLGSTNLYNADSADETKAMYTFKLTNCSRLDTEAFVNPVLDTSFGSTMSFKVTSSTGSSNRLPWLSHSFRLSDNLLKASQYGYLNVSASAGVQMPSSEKAHLKTVLYSGTLSDSDISSIASSSFNMQTLSTTTEASSHTVTLSNQTTRDYMLLFALNRDGGGTMSMNITQPTLTISSSDVSAPSVEFTCDNTWKNTDKTLYIKVTDSESGIMSVVGADGKELNIESREVADGNKEQYYTMNIPENGNYGVVVTDNVGNTRTYTYTEEHIDKTAPSIPSIIIPTLSFSQNVSVTLNSLEKTGSAEKVYYTIDGAEPTISSNVLSEGENVINFPWGENISFKAIAIDDAGNRGEIYSSIINVVERFVVNLEKINCNVEVVSEPVVDNIDGVQKYMGESVVVTVAPHTGYQFRRMEVDGVGYTLNENAQYQFVATQDTNVRVLCAYTLRTQSYTTEYVYDPNVEYLEPIFTINVSGLELDIQLLDEGGKVVEISQLKDAGTYTLIWSYESDEYVGRESFNFEITPITITISAIEDQWKVYGDSEPENFEYTVAGLPEGQDLVAVLGRAEGDGVGNYPLTLVSTNLNTRNYNVDFVSESFTIRPRKIVLAIDSKSKQYGDIDPELTYSVLDGEVMGEDTFSGNLTRVAGENVGMYDISIGSVGNANYEIIAVAGVLTISKRDIQVAIDNIETIYGIDKPLTYSVADGIDATQFVGELTRESGNGVGRYLITKGSLDSANYNIIVSGEPAYYVVLPKHISVVANSSSKVYGEEDILTYSVDGLVEGDVLSGSLERVSGENVGEYDILQGSLNNANYILDYESAKLTIAPAELTLNIQDIYQVYGEVSEDFVYTLVGIKNGDKVGARLERVPGENVGEYEISCKGIDNSNYVLGTVNTGIYHITKATIVPTINSSKFVYSGRTYYASSNFPFPLQYVYKKNGIECDGMLGAGEYSVVAQFEGNENYNPSNSEIASIVVAKQDVYVTISKTQFVYNGSVQMPEYIYDMSCGLDQDKIVVYFENNIMPVECGEYRFDIVSLDSNYVISASGVLEIANLFSITNSNGSILECADATFDDRCQDIVLVEKSLKGELNDNKILSTCTFENIEEDDDYIYTAKIKANSDSQKIHIYQLGKDNSIREVVVLQENGYYVFKVDSLTDTFVITREKEPLPMWFWLVLVGGVAVALVVTVKIVKNARKKKLARENVNNLDTYNIN